MGQGLDDVSRATPVRGLDVFESNNGARCHAREFPSHPETLNQQHRRAFHGAKPLTNTMAFHSNVRRQEIHAVWGIESTRG
jgi:hypothetical protein